MSQCTLQSNRPKTIVRLGNDTPLLLALTTSSGEVINLNEVANLSVAIVSARSGKVITPPWQVTSSGGLSIEFSSSNQSIGIYGLRVQFDRPSGGFSDGQQAYAWEDTNLIEVVPTSTALPSDAPNTISGVLGALMKGDPGDPTELLDELSRQQSARMDEIATAQRESLTSIRARLSDEQRTTLEGLAGRLSREQAGQIAQQTERLSTEQASGLQTISDRLSSEQTQTLERQGQERATAQADALKALDEQVNRKYDTALRDLSGKVTDEVGRLMPEAVGGRLGGEVQMQLPRIVDGKASEFLEAKLPDIIDDSAAKILPSIIGVDDQSRLTIGGKPVAEIPRGRDGKTPYIKDRTWWIGDTDTGVTAEVNRDIFSVEDWLKMGNLTAYNALVATWYNNVQGASSWTPQDVVDRYTSGDKGSGVVAVVGHRGMRRYTYHWYLIPDISEYGDNLILNLKYYDSGFASVYWLSAGVWQSVSTRPGEEAVTCHIEHPDGPVAIFFSAHDTVVTVLDVYSSSTDNISYPMGTWLARNKAPRKGDTYLCTNIGSQGERVLLAYDGHNWLTSWGGRITGETTREARDSYLQAILALRKAIITPPNLAEG